MQANQENMFQLLWKLWRGKTVVTRADAVWGIFALSASVMLFLFLLALSFWAISISLDGGKIMSPSSPLSWLFFSFAILSFVLWLISVVFVLRVGNRWYKNHPITDAPVKLSQESINDISGRLTESVTNKLESLVNNIGTLVSEIRQERNERNNEPKQQSDNL